MNDVDGHTTLDGQEVQGLFEAGPEDRLELLDGIRERMKQHNLSPIENYVMQKAIALFLLGERVGWGTLHSRSILDGLAELPALRTSDDENDGEVCEAIDSLEGKGLLFFERDEQSTARIGSIQQSQSVLVRSVFHFERKRALKEQKLKELSTKREAHEISPFDLDLNFIVQLNEAGLPLTRKGMEHETGNQALVLTPDDFAALGCLDFIHSSGERMLIESESLDMNDIFILYPHEVGDAEK